MNALATSVIIDYQNMHLTGHELFRGHGQSRLRDTILNPLELAQRLVTRRNLDQKPGYALATLEHVAVFRGLPSSTHNPRGYSLGLSEKAAWEQDDRVQVTLRPLQYLLRRDPNGRSMRDSEGNLLIAHTQEKGIDVLCALALIREARRPDVDLVILASHDTDLEPALDEALALNCARVETCQWYLAGAPAGQRRLRPLHATRPVWNTRLTREDFEAAIDGRD